jgi:hypothetical protein
MSIHLAPTVKTEPHVLLTHWMLLETANKTRHFVGYCSKTKTGRVSSAIRYFDPYRRRGVTESGRVYEFIGSAGINAPVKYVLERWLAVKYIPTWHDVSDELAIYENTTLSDTITRGRIKRGAHEIAAAH